jgi:4-diphosphocytidyl-2-C-methyl-D-erythritol kinase
MIRFPNCKINLGLRVIRRREDGYHDIETAMVPVGGLCDALEILPDGAQGCTFTSSGLTIDAPAERNLCVRAYKLMRERYGIGGVRMHLHKHIPFGAGLGGGSADAVFVLTMLNDLFGLLLSEAKLKALAAELGSDTAFFVENRPMLATGRGEILTPVAIDLSGYRIVVVKPPLSVSTAEAYAGITPAAAEIPLAEILTGDIRTWKDTLKNDFEPVIFKKHPEIAAIKEWLYDSGAVYAAMSGSGSAVFGLFAREPETVAFPDDYFVWCGDMY